MGAVFCVPRHCQPVLSELAYRDMVPGFMSCRGTLEQYLTGPESRHAVVMVVVIVVVTVVVMGVVVIPVIILIIVVLWRSDVRIALGWRAPIPYPATVAAWMAG